MSMFASTVGYSLPPDEEAIRARAKAEAAQKHRLRRSVVTKKR
jgi:hypothetical protein